MSSEEAMKDGRRQNARVAATRGAGAAGRSGIAVRHENAPARRRCVTPGEPENARERNRSRSTLEMSHPTWRTLMYSANARRSTPIGVESCRACRHKSGDGPEMSSLLRCSGQMVNAKCCAARGVVPTRLPGCNRSHRMEIAPVRVAQKSRVVDVGEGNMQRHQAPSWLFGR